MLAIKIEIGQKKKEGKQSTTHTSRESRVAILTSDKVDFGANNMTRDKKDHFIMMKDQFN